MKKTLLSLFAAFGMLASVCAENVSVIVDKADYTEDPQITGFAITDKNDILTGTAALEYGTHGNGIWSITFYVKEGTTKEALDASVTSDSFSFSPSDLQVQYLGNFLTGDYTAPISSNGVLFMVGDIQIWVYYEETMEEVEKPVINNGYQIPNSDFEAWVSDKEPGNGWNSFASAVGDMSWASSMSPAPQKVEGRNSGSAVELNSKNIFGKKANGNLTTGAINMGSMTPEDSTKNYNFTDLDNEGHYFLFKGTPDSVCLYAKFISGGSENGRGRFILHDKFEYQESGTVRRQCPHGRRRHNPDSRMRRMDPFQCAVLLHRNDRSRGRTIYAGFAHDQSQSRAVRPTTRLPLTTSRSSTTPSSTPSSSQERHWKDSIRKLTPIL